MNFLLPRRLLHACVQSGDALLHNEDIPRLGA
jgi:hypothetical protein